MLVHKESGGVLYEAWEGVQATKNGVTYYPLRRGFTCKLLELDSRHWWEVPDGSSLAKRLLRCYPCFDPVTDEAGRLMDIVAWPKWRVDGEEAPTIEELRQPKKRRMVKMNNGNKWKRGGSLV